MSNEIRANIQIKDGTIDESLLDVVNAPVNNYTLCWNDSSGKFEWKPAATTSGSGSLNDLTDVDTTGVVIDQVLTYNGSIWVPGESVVTISGSIIENLTSQINGVTDHFDLSNHANAAQVFYNGLNLVSNDYTLDLDGLGFTLAFVPRTTDTLVTTYNNTGASITGLLPAGGTTGQTLTKLSAANFDVNWGTPVVSSTASKIEIGVNGNGSVITTGILLDFEVPCNMTITSWTVLADLSGSIQFDLWKDSYANFPPTVTDTCVGSDKPKIVSDTKSTGSALTGWDTTWTTGEIVRVNIDSVATITRATLTLTYTRS
jgi:hypothetical protein